MVAVMSAASAAATPAVAPWTLDSCVSYAVEHNISVRSMRLREEGERLGLTEAKDRFLPTVRASASQDFNFGRGLTSRNIYADRNTSQFSWNAGVSLPVFQGLAEYRGIALAKASIERALYDTEAAGDDVALNVISRYLQALYAKEVVESSRSQLALSEFEVKRQTEMIRAGKAAEVTRYDLEAVAARDRVQVVQAEDDLQVVLEELASLLQLEDMTGFDVSPLPYVGGDLPSADSVYEAALSSNNALQSARSSVIVADRQISYARSSYLPTLGFNAGLGSGYYRISGENNDSFSSQMRHNYATYLGFSLNIPIFDAFATRNSVRRASLQKTTAELELDDRRYSLRKDIRLAHLQASGARQRMAATEEALRKTRLSFDATRERFGLGVATIADYEQAKNNLFLTEISAIQARCEYIMRRRILLFYRDGRK